VMNGATSRIVSWLSRRPVVSASLTWLAVFLGISLFFIARGVDQQTYQLAAHGKRVTATITHIDRSDHNSCSYTFTVGERAYSRTAYGCADSRNPGDLIAITYLPSDPNSNVTGSASLRDLTPLFELPALLATVAAIGVGGNVARSRRRRVEDDSSDNRPGF